MHVICYTVLHRRFPRQFENKDTIFWVEGVSDLAYELCYCVGIAANRIPKKQVTWFSDTEIFFLGVSNDWA